MLNHLFPLDFLLFSGNYIPEFWSGAPVLLSVHDLSPVYEAYRHAPVSLKSCPNEVVLTREKIVLLQKNEKMEILRIPFLSFILLISHQ